MADEQSKERTWYRVRHLLNADAKEAGVPFWNVDRLFTELCDAYLRYEKKSLSVELCFVSPFDFTHMARKATKIPIIRPHGSDERRIHALANALYLHACTLLSEISGIPCESVGNGMSFGRHSSGKATDSPVRSVTWEVQRRSEARGVRS